MSQDGSTAGAVDPLAADGERETRTNGLDPDTAAKARAARDALDDRSGVLVAFSGGVDSSVVAALAHDALGADAVACTARSETLPAAELDDATRVAEEIGIRHDTVTFSELDDPAFVANDDDRCYHCRTMRLGRMYDRARELGIDTVCDGTNADDPGEGHRPGLRAVEELDVVSPLLDADITKPEVRSIADAYGLSVADKPSMACLSSRIPTGLAVTEERLSRVEKAERLLREWGFAGFRVRDHDGLARVEIAPDELERALDPAFAAAVHEHLTDLGFEYVTLDMAGYRTGSVSPGGDETDGNEADGDEDESGDTVGAGGRTRAEDDETERDEAGGDERTAQGSEPAGTGSDTATERRTDGLDLGREYPR